MPEDRNVVKYMRRLAPSLTEAMEHDEKIELAAALITTLASLYATTPRKAFAERVVPALIGRHKVIRLDYMNFSAGKEAEAALARIAKRSKA